MLYKTPSSRMRRNMGPFTIISNLPGFAVPGHGDHGYRGSAEVNGISLSLAEGALLVDEDKVAITATSDAVLLVFLISRPATLAHAGTIGQ